MRHLWWKKYELRGASGVRLHGITLSKAGLCRKISAGKSYSITSARNSHADAIICGSCDSNDLKGECELGKTPNKTMRVYEEVYTRHRAQQKWYTDSSYSQMQEDSGAENPNISHILDAT